MYDRYRNVHHKDMSAIKRKRNVRHKIFPRKKRKRKCLPQDDYVHEKTQNEIFATSYGGHFFSLFLRTYLVADIFFHVVADISELGPAKGFCTL